MSIKCLWTCQNLNHKKIIDKLKILAKEQTQLKEIWKKSPLKQIRKLKSAIIDFHSTLYDPR